MKTTQFSGTGTGYRKVKKQDNFSLLRKIRKECATEFMTLADYVISGNKIREKEQNGTLCNSHLRKYNENKVKESFSIHKHVWRYTALSSGNAGMKLLTLFSAFFVLIMGLIIGSLWYAVVRGEFTRFATKQNYKDVLLNLNSKFAVCRKLNSESLC